MKAPQKKPKTSSKTLTPKQKRAIEKGAIMFSKNSVEVMKRLAKS